MDLYEDGYLVTYNEGDVSVQQDGIPYVSSDTDEYHTVIEGQTLMDIANIFYKSAREWFIIAYINSIINPFELTPGTILIIPDRDKISSINE